LKPLVALLLLLPPTMTMGTWCPTWCLAADHEYMVPAQPPADHEYMVPEESKTVAQWAEELNSEEFRQQWHAAYVLGTLGRQAAPAVPALHAVLDVNSGKNEYARSMAAWALGRIGAAAEAEIPFLRETMRSTKLLAVRRSTAEALGSFGPAAKPAVSDLVKMLDNDDDITRVNAAVALWKIDRHPKAVPALLAMLRQGDPSQTFAAADALGQMETEAAAVAPALIEALHAPVGDVRRAAARSLGQLGKAAFPAIEKAKALQDPDAETRRMVVEALSWMGPDAADHEYMVPALKAALGDESPAVRREAARALGNLGAEAQAARDALEKAASDPQEDVRTAAGKALRRIRGE
jgi:HEAT repeat protein